VRKVYKVSKVFKVSKGTQALPDQLEHKVFKVLQGRLVLKVAKE
jgi:hypothetical protein